MEAFDPHKLRDRRYKQSFAEKLAEIEAVRRTHQFVHYSLNRPRFHELVEIYQQNVAEYETSFAQNMEKYEQLHVMLDKDTEGLHPQRRTQGLGQLKDILPKLEEEDYAINREAGEALDRLTQEIESYKQELGHWKDGLEQFRAKLKDTMIQIWSEDYAQLKSIYQNLKDQILGEELPSKEMADFQALFSQFIQRKSGDITMLRAATKNRPRWRKQIDELATTYASYERYEALKRSIGLGKWKQKAVYWAAAVLAAVAVGAGIYLGPKAYFQKQQEALWTKTTMQDSYEAYQEYLDEYPYGTHAKDAHARMLEMPSGKIIGLMTEGGTKFDYEGELHLGRPEGEGVGVFENGDVYEGTWKNGLPSGRGLLNEVNGHQYDGEWQGGIRQGKGKQIYTDGTMYTGAWTNDVWNGQGTLQKADGTSYSGTWNMGIFPVRGVVRYAKGGSYEGGWIKEGIKHGIGTMQWPDGKRYTGEWQQGRRHGNGTMEWNDRSRFVGQWQNDHIQGRGIYTDRFRAEYRGLWEADSVSVRFFDERSKELIKKGQFKQGVFIGE